MEVFRIHDRRYGALNGTGAALRGGRWNPFGVPVVYASRSYEGALLETLAQTEIGRIPIGRVASRIHVPEDCRVETLEEADWPDWHDRVRSHQIGRDWVDARHSVALVVPSYVARPWGLNVVLNPHHLDFRAVHVAEDVPVTWDARLF